MGFLQKNVKFYSYALGIKKVRKRNRQYGNADFGNI